MVKHEVVGLAVLLYGIATIEYRAIPSVGLIAALVGLIIAIFPRAERNG